ncbi:flavin reductase family protein [Paraburkholderia sp. J12]|uniref:flavin reductase family protein n=1 Tax=Paraburkholderia sp. J12 TaxID=2805432 RepID=UPI002ABE6BEA|nr:flavin reductase family protein [Paraburkholderia sp. J12]
MEIAIDSLNVESSYKLLTGIVVPRPIAWVTTINEDGVVNLAPFSCFTFVSAYPPMVAINFGRKAGNMKDTPSNIHLNKEYVVNIADETMMNDLHQSSFEYPSHVSEVGELGLETAPSTIVRPPRLARAPASMECRFNQQLEFGDTGSQFIVGDVVMFHVRDDLYSNGKIETEQMRPLMRLGGPVYGTLGQVHRPKPIPLSEQTIYKKG